MDEVATPYIVPRAEHSLSRALIDPDALKILYRLHGNGFKAFLVGGCVRDLLLRKPPKDFDIVTDAHPQQIRDLFRNSRLIGRRFRLAHVFFRGGKYIEVSTFRRRSEFEEEANEEGSGHPPDENTFGTPSEDAFRRDITINGVFYDIADFSLVDYVSGLEDLKRGIVRCIGDPEEKFTQDPVRMIRVIRHASRKGFVIEEETYASLVRHVDKLTRCSPARVRDEFLREIKEGSARESMARMLATGMFFVLFPEFREPLADEGRKELFLKFMGVLDDLSLAEEPLADEFSLSLFLFSFLDLFCPGGDLPVGRSGQAAFQHQVREWVLATLERLQFTRHAKEAVSHLLGAQRIFRELRRQEQLPRRFLKQPHFPQARRLFEIESRVRGDAPEEFTETETPELPRKKRRRKRHRRKKTAPGLAQAADSVALPPQG